MDTFLWILSAIAQAGMAVIGFWLTMSPATATSHGKPLAGTFGALTLLAFFASGWGFIRSSNSSAIVAQLTSQILDEVKGSPDAYSVVTPLYGKGVPLVGDRDATRFLINNQSGKPMMGVSVTICNESKRSSGDPLFMGYVGDLYERGAVPINYIGTLNKDVDNIFHIMVNSRSSNLDQFIVMSWDGEKWVTDYHLSRSDKSDFHLTPIKKIRNDFPFRQEDTRKYFLEMLKMGTSP